MPLYPLGLRPDATSGTGDTDIELNYDANSSPTPRTATLMMQSTDAGASTVLMASIKVDQEGMEGDVLGFPPSARNDFLLSQPCSFAFAYTRRGFGQGELCSLSAL